MLQVSTAMFSWPLGPDLSGKSNSNGNLGKWASRQKSISCRFVSDPLQRPAVLIACLLRLRTHIFEWPQVTPIRLQKTRFAKGLLAHTGTILQGARSTTPEFLFDAAAPGPSAQAARFFICFFWSLQDQKVHRYFGVHSWEPPGTSRYAQHQR